MVESLKHNGVEFLSKSEVINMDDQSASGVVLTLKTGEKMNAKNVVVATGSWSGKLLKKSGYQLPVQDGKGYSMTIKQPVLKPTIPSILHEARVAITPMLDDLRISGTLEISGMDDKINQHKVDSILKAVPEYYPQLKMNSPGSVWYGYRPCTPDGMPYIGRLTQGSSVIIAAGHAMMGLSLAPVTGRMVKDLLMTSSKPGSADKLDPSRFTYG